MLIAGSACGFGCILGSRYTEEISQSRLSAERGPPGESHQHNMTEGTISCTSAVLPENSCTASHPTAPMVITTFQVSGSLYGFIIQGDCPPHCHPSFESGRSKSWAEIPHLSNEQLNEQVVHSVSVDFLC